jgi:hypothetical protein
MAMCGATRDSDLLVPDGEEADETILRFLELADARRLSDGKKLTIDDIADTEHLRVNSRAASSTSFGVAPRRLTSTRFPIEQIRRSGKVRWSGLPSVVGFKRLARRPQDRVDLEELEAIHGDLPVEPIPGLDS